MQVTLGQLLKRVQSYTQAESDLEFVRRAFQYADVAHTGQLRKSGEPYIYHPLAVAFILADLELDMATIAAGLLHDVVEDTPITLEELEKEFGPEVALLVDGVTKLSRLEVRSKQEQQVESLRKMFLAMAKDIRVILIKLADRLHNMRTLRHQKPEKQREIAEETIELFAPLANRLGISRIKWELEDLSLRYLEPETYYDLVQRIATKRAEREERINDIIQELSEKLEAVGVKADISGRPKHFYSIYRKMTNQKKDLSEIYDLIAVRVLVDSVKDCYGALGIIHTIWKPIPMRFKDYIATPKTNMYQSLHTTLVGPMGEPFEVQIRTFEMHRTAEYGIAAHWKYKEGGKSQGTGFEEKLAWLRQLQEWQSEQKDTQTFMESLKIEFFSDAVFIFTPKGDVIELPAGSTPIDFAYRIHSNVGHRCMGAKVNGRIVPIDYKLSNGEIIEILTKSTPGPSRDWLNVVKTSNARNRIRQWFKKEKREEFVDRGKESLERELKKLNLEPSEVLKTDRLMEISKRFNFQTVDDVYFALGDGTLTNNQIISRLKEELKKEKKFEEEAAVPPEVKPFSGFGKPSQGVRVRGVDNVLIRFSRCCNPLPGDDILGYITKGRGVSIHRSDCVNIVHMSTEEKERMVEVAWDTQSNATYQVELEVISLDRVGLTTDVMIAVTDTKTSINSIYSRATKNKMAQINMVVEIRDMGHLRFIMEKISKVRDVLEVRRLTPNTKPDKESLLG
ncbi:bifunctional (p)ppGpp synthetase/guanosine-3',5'-bis(diphosphate) 3'-pyrophosphohydrolase [Heliobacterium chlorum]|uniref:GTP diphosphokinase n=1 Tax=Heliobacterium chlorum TaxID=2698 RepID=A0ABR7T4G2_HELCL|nr:bifunctional (p)ppGpp synthetase/guanosine-3',5'-bis(diphosphate) 3'-pyrophosphohydrolase [Heliobacterium chlorum]MBC9785654.1 bifunctional (p)ppGpp synthetase/guanosine-3',5'-bis(diphosphate) 3'-pyrophosphohydrolase [Heliobacterium chlorum]